MARGRIGMGAWGFVASVPVAALVWGCAQGSAELSVDASLATTTDATTHPGDAPTAVDASNASDSGDDSGMTFIGFDTGAPADAVSDAVVADAGVVDGGQDAGSTAKDSGGVDAPPADTSTTCPPGTTGPGCAQCASGFHLCGATCTANAANNPSTGCANSCGTGACPAGSNETASCTAGGDCTTGCSAGTKMCPGTTTCSACCTNSDCPTNVACNQGTCSVCLGNFGTCVTLCDTDLTTNDNCGSCGNSCSTNPFECFIGFGGCGCQGGGPPTPADWSCN